MLTSHACRRSAELCDKLAEEAADKVDKTILSGIATQWRRLANRMDTKAKKKREAAQPAKTDVGFANKP